MNTWSGVASKSTDLTGLLTLETAVRVETGSEGAARCVDRTLVDVVATFRPLKAFRARTNYLVVFHGARGAVRTRVGTAEVHFNLDMFVHVI